MGQFRSDFLLYPLNRIPTVDQNHPKRTPQATATVPYFFRLLSYSFRYRSRFIAGVVLSFFVAVLNGLSLTMFVPLFDALGDRNAVFLIQVTESERKILTYVINNFSELEFLPGKRVEIPTGKEKIDQQLSGRLLHFMAKKNDFGLSPIQNFQLRTIIKWKLKINQAGYSPVKIVYTASLIVFPLYFLRLLLHLVTVKLIARTGYKAVRDLRSDLYRKMQELPLTYFYREKTGLLMSRMINDVEIVAAVISSNMRDAITNLFLILTHVALLAYLNTNLLLISVVSVPLILSPVTLFTRKIRKSTNQSQGLLADLNAHIQEVIQGIRVIRAYGMEEYEADRFRTVNQKLYWRTFKQNFYLKMGPNMVELTSALVTVGVIMLGAMFLDPVNFTSGEFIAFLIILLVIIRPIIQLSGMYSKIQVAEAAGSRIFEIMDMKSDINDPTHPVKLTPMKRGIRFEDVRFSYPGTDREVLHGINLEIPVGSTVALVGKSGGGKSTLMDLMARFFEPVSGQITIDGIPIHGFNVADHRSRIGIVTQEIFLFYGTVHENIAYGNQAYSRKDVEKAARLAHAHDFIKEMPQGYDTMIGERGANISGGQRQRIAIARALLRDPEILILDEATSALDTESERIVQAALERLFKNRTTFVIAHRLSTIEKADFIVVVDDGEIQELGTHDQLMNNEGMYARLQEISRKATSPPPPGP